MVNPLGTAGCHKKLIYVYVSKTVKVKVRLSHYRPEEVHKVPGG
jgi:hypothetical protein